MRRILVLALLVVTACTPRGVITLAPEAASIGIQREVFVGTTRAIDPETGRFGSRRSEQPTFARYDVSIPPGHKAGDITWPPRGQKPNPQRDFLTTAEVIHPGAKAFRADMARAFALDKRGDRDAVIYVHGFNNTFSEGLYRIAQLSKDLDMPGVTAHYSWPSAGNPLGYVYDRDSATFARDGLEQLINEVSAAGADRILLVAHSMGSALTVETLRQIVIRGDTRIRNKIAGVILISPDIDVEVFRAQALSIGELPQPFLIFGSNRDKLLNISAKITGQTERLGSMEDVSKLADLKVTFLDVAAYTEGSGHFALGDSPALLNLMNRIGEVDSAFSADQTGRVGLLPGVVLTVQRATQIVLAPVGVISNELTK